MVRDDGVDPEFARVGDRLHRGDAAVHGDDQRAATPMRLVDGALGEPVAVVDAVRDVVLDPCTQLFERAGEQERRGDAVDVVIPCTNMRSPFATPARMRSTARSRSSMWEGSCRFSSEGSRKSRASDSRRMPRLTSACPTATGEPRARASAEAASGEWFGCSTHCGEAVTIGGMGDPGARARDSRDERRL
jgi:hypothetical protein